MGIPRIFALLLVASVLPWSALHAGGGKGGHAFSFHTEGREGDGPGRVFPLPVLGQERYFQLSPDITMLDFEAFSVFPARDGQTMGAAFLLKHLAKSRLTQISASRQGTYMVVVVDGQPVDVMLIDRPIEDGVLVIWGGLNAGHIEYLTKKLKLPQLERAAP